MKNKSGVILCALLAYPAYLCGSLLPVVGAPVFGILIGILGAMVIKNKSELRAKIRPGIQFTSKKILQAAVVLLGFGMNLGVVVKTGMTSLPVILSTISISLLVSFVYYRIAKVPYKNAVLIGVGSSICGGSAIAATAPVIGADEEEVAQAISVIFLFNVIAALIFPTLGILLGLSNEGFSIFAGTAVNDTSSVTAAASAWDSIHGTGSMVLDAAAVIKMTRTLAIIPITLVLGMMQGRNQNNSIKKSFPTFILFFLLASLITTCSIGAGIDPEVFTMFKTISKYLIVMAMVAIGFCTDIKKLIRTGAKPMIQGFLCWVSIALTSLLMQHILSIW